MPPLLVAAIVAGFACVLREHRARTHMIRMRELALARECLDKHAAALEQILEDPGAPTELKKLAISVSDAMIDRQRTLTPTWAMRPQA